jgi:hypothetical protein
MWKPGWALLTATGETIRENEMDQNLSLGEQI